MSAPASTTATRQAVQLTGQTLRARLISYRVVVIAVGMFVLASLVGAVAWLSWLPLLGTLLLLPVGDLFFCRDANLVGRWQRRILDLWAAEQVDLDIFAHTVRSYKMLPPNMVQGMLQSLPAQKKGTSVAPVMRKALSLTVEAINRSQTDRPLFAVLAYTTGLACLSWALVEWSWLPLVGLLGVPLLRAVGAGLVRWRFRRCKRHLLGLLSQELELQSFVEAAVHLEWEGIADRHRDRLLQSLLNAHHPRRS